MKLHGWTNEEMARVLADLADCVPVPADPSRAFHSACRNMMLVRAKTQSFTGLLAMFYSRTKGAELRFSKSELLEHDVIIITAANKYPSLLKSTPLCVGRSCQLCIALPS